MTDNNPLLSVRGLCASAGDLDILNGVDLEVYSGEVHAIMGPTAPARAPSPTSWPAVPTTP